MTDYNQGETVMVELDSGYKWEAEVVEHVINDKPYQPYDDEYLILEAGKHPARDDTGRMTVQLSDGSQDKGTVYGPTNNKKYQARGIWRMDSI